MRIQIIGDCDSAKSLRGLLGRAGFAISDKNSFYTINLTQNDSLSYVQVDSIDCELERTIIQCIGELGVKQFLLRRDFAMPSDREITITLPEHLSYEVEIGIMRAMIRCVTPKNVEVEMIPPTKWYKRFLHKKLLPIILFLLPTISEAFPLNSQVRYIPFNPMLLQTTNFPIVRFWDGSQIVNAGDAVNNAVRVNIVAGGAAGGGTSSTFGAAFPATGTAAGFISSTGTMTGANLDASGNLEVACLIGCGGSSFLDNTAFTFGTSVISNTGFVVDDVAPNAVAENSAGAPRMSSNRIPYNSLHTDAGVALLGQQVMTASLPVVPSSDYYAPEVGLTKTLSAECLDPCLTSVEVANSVAKIELKNMGAAQLLFQTSSPALGTFIFEDSIANNFVRLLDGQRLTSSAPYFSDPIALHTYTPNITPGAKWVRLRWRTRVSGTTNVVWNANNQTNYAFALPFTGWPTVQIPQRAALTGNADGTASCNGSGYPCLVNDIAKTTAPVGTESGKFVRLVSGPNTSAVTAAWTSATGLDTALTLTTTGTNMIACTSNITGGTVTAGTINIEVSDNAGANWYQTGATIMYTAGTGPTVSTTYLPVLSNAVIERQVSGYNAFRLRLNPVITGAGTVNLRCQSGSFPSSSMTAISTISPGVTALTLGKSEDAIAASGDTGVSVLYERIDPTTTEQTSATVDYGRPGIDSYGAQFSGRHPNSWSCFVPLTATVTTECKAVAAAGMKHYVTSISLSNGAATVQGVDIVFGTGAACATGITALSHKFQMGTNQLTTSPFDISHTFGSNTPLVPATAATAICTRPTAATAYGATITGFTAR